MNEASQRRARISAVQDLLRRLHARARVSIGDPVRRKTYVALANKARRIITRFSPVRESLEHYLRDFGGRNAPGS